MVIGKDINYRLSVSGLCQLITLYSKSLWAFISVTNNHNNPVTDLICSVNVYYVKSFKYEVNLGGL